MDIHDQDIADGLENCITKDGQNSPSANLPMNSHKHTGVADAVAATEYAAYGQLLALVSPFVGATNVGGTANAITLTPTPTITSYTTGKGFSFFIETANTGAVTLAVAGLAAVGLRRSDGTNFTSGDLVVGRHVVAVYNGAQFRTNIAPPTDAAITLSDIPNLPASKTTSGTFHVERIATLLTQAAYDAITPDETKVYFISGLTMAFNRDSSLDISLGTGFWGGRCVRRHHALVC